ncbi:MAG: transglycosylase SLT domain-containing protein [Archangium sp.]|nr:transglycosylase SLT domain-containing protein [Archangium sp.]MDP3152485.1 transglycosylase SLT domain-containing protein [Archangium sp.]MDP3572345.1 transglycosylase SLT domain-containing protein [Archangium sp.]
MTNGIGGTRPLPSLPRARNAEIDVRTLAPWIAKYAGKYGVNPQIVAAVVAQESSFINHGVHDDGTGHGLIGLDDNGLLPEFEKWSGTRVGRGHRANTIAPEKQIEFLAMKLDKLTEKFGGREWEAVRAWHGGNGGRNRPHAKHYEQLIRGRIPQIAHAVPRVISGAAAPEEMLASSYQPNAPKPVALQSEEGTPIRGAGIDYETA